MVLLCAQRLCYRRDQLNCSPPNGLNHYLQLNKTGAHSTGERFRAIMALLWFYVLPLIMGICIPELAVPTTNHVVCNKVQPYSFSDASL